METKTKITIYQGQSGEVQLTLDVATQTIWASQSEMASIFGVNSQAISKHLKKIYKEGELSQNSTCSILEQVQLLHFLYQLNFH